MKKILFAASLLLFVGAIGTTAYAATNSSDAQTEITKNDDDKKKKKKKKKKKTKGSKGKAKKAIGDAMKEKDSAEALGDAIRDRADALRQDSTDGDPLLQSIDGSVASVGRAMGASDYDGDAGGVEASQSSVIANYFLKSHGGAHLLQSAMSLLATLCAVGSLGLASKYSPKAADGGIGNAKWTLVLLRRTMIFAMIKHVSGLLASASMAAKAIPKIGITESRKWMEDVVKEPVAQYVFYTALLLLWLPSKTFLLAAAEDGAKSIATTWWWPRQRWIVSVLVGPILLREIVSTVLVISDVLVLWSVGSKNDNAILERVLGIAQSGVNAVMSLLVSPSKWRSADSSQRQEILAGLVSKVSLFLEAYVGAVLVVDLVVGFLQMVFGVMGGRKAWYETLTKLVVIRLYVHYLVWIRRNKLSKLATDIRGGAAQLPFWFLDSLYDPAKAIGVSKAKVGKEDKNEVSSWQDCVAVGLGLEQSS
mmetsp:Transcript_26064/g.58073  ORF Transcript_26064/g.58073 Transcript_26064/m.58073 type:complete len:478 (-) Transcript_26064:515-1948(-)